MVAKSPQALARRRAQKRRYKRLRREHFAEVNSAWSIKKKYGVTEMLYQTILKSQNGGCAICQATISGRPQDRRLIVDHCHNTNAVRGLLCHRCNTAIGMLKDDPNLLDAAAAYLRRSPILPDTQMRLL